jgi:hypothetical protein
VVVFKRKEIAMQLIALPLALVLSSATDVPSPPASAGEPQAAIRELQPGDISGGQCRDGNLPAGENPNSQPRFERGPASPDMSQIIYAVDWRVDGCSVILTKYGIGDVRRLLWQSDAILPASPSDQGK